jgi:outer membrane receptor protein involved in Fe transport
MARLQSTVILLVLSVLVEWASGFTSSGVTRTVTPPTASKAEQSASRPSSQISDAGTGITTPHPHKDSPLKIERVIGDMLRQARATHVGQSLQDMPGVQTGR